MPKLVIEIEESDAIVVIGMLNTCASDYRTSQSYARVADSVTDLISEARERNACKARHPSNSNRQMPSHERYLDLVAGKPIKSKRITEMTDTELQKVIRTDPWQSNVAAARMELARRWN